MKRNTIIVFICTLFLLSCNQKIEYYIPVIKNYNLEVFDQSNSPVSNYVVRFYTTYKPDVIAYEKKTDYNGLVTIGNLAPGNYTAKVFGDGTDALKSFAVTVGNDDSLNSSQMKLENNVPKYAFTLKVKQDVTNRVVKNRKVVLSLDKNLATTVSEGTTNSSGVFVFQQVRDYSYFINVFDEEGIEVVKQEAVEIGRNSTTYEMTLKTPTRIIHNADFVITGLMVNLKGYDCKDVGYVSWNITYPGEFEYVQFMALKDIDFTVTPYCMVTCWNGSATSLFPTTKGWIEGKNGNRSTYQININQGSVKKGQFFMVGGRSRLLCGINESYISPSISTDKWIVAKNFWGEAGDDGNGSKTGDNGILDGNGEADGVAVFRGTVINENTVPMDAVFFGPTVALKHYYQIPDNDLYNRKNLGTDEDQPFFSSGTNTTTMGASLGDVGDFYLLGGKVTPKAWLLPRVPNQHIALNWKTMTPQLSNIESGSLVTKFVDE